MFDTIMAIFFIIVMWGMFSALCIACIEEWIDNSKIRAWLRILSLTPLSMPIGFLLFIIICVSYAVYHVYKVIANQIMEIKREFRRPNSRRW